MKGPVNIRCLGRLSSKRKRKLRELNAVPTFAEIKRLRSRRRAANPTAPFLRGDC